MLTVYQVAIQLMISRNTVVNLIKKGHLKALKVGGQYRIPQVSFDQYLKDVKYNDLLEDLIKKSFRNEEKGSPCSYCQGKGYNLPFE